MLARTKGLVLTGFALAAAAGFASGYLYANNRLGEKFDEKLAEELAAAQHVYKIVAKNQEFDTPEEAAEALARETAAKEALELYQPKPKTVGTMPREAPPVYERARNWTPGVVAGEVPEDRKNNIFDDAQLHQSVSFDYADEVRNRTEEAPYIISVEEFGANETDFRQVTLTYYEGDGVLADERDDKIDNIDEMVGDDNIPRFGHRSGDNNVLYVRNHVFEIEIEINRDHRKYAEVVLGFEP